MNEVGNCEVVLGSVVELFRDPEDEKVSEGFAKVWAIQNETDDYYELIVSFMDDPKAPTRRFVRRLKKKQF